MHFLVSILKIKILLFLKLFGTFFMKFLCNVELLIRSLTNLIMNSGGKWVTTKTLLFLPLIFFQVIAF